MECHDLPKAEAMEIDATGDVNSARTNGDVCIYTMGVRPCVTAKLPVLRPWFWNFILLNLVVADFAATPQGCCACVGQVVVCHAASLHLSMLRQKSEKRP